jgi:hypothetical protein
MKIGITKSKGWECWCDEEWGMFCYNCESNYIDEKLKSKKIKKLKPDAGNTDCFKLVRANEDSFYF